SDDASPDEGTAFPPALTRAILRAAAGGCRRDDLGHRVAGPEPVHAGTGFAACAPAGMPGAPVARDRRAVLHPRLRTADLGVLRGGWALCARAPVHRAEPG